MRRMETARESVGLSLVLAFKSLQSASWEPSAAARRVLPPPTTRARLGVRLKVRWPALERTLKLCLCHPLVCTGYAPERRWCPLRRRRRRTNSSVSFVGLSGVEPSQTNPLGFSRDGLPWAGLRVGPVINRTMYRAACEDSIKRIRCVSTVQDLRDADLVVEAIVENEDVKKKLFVELDKITKSSAILASNTSSISITRLASATKRPSQVIGMHFFNPPPIMKLIEIIRGADTSDEVFAAIKSFSERLGKSVICSQDYPGFIVNRILMPMINEAFWALYTGVATKEDIDTGMKLGTNHPMGPLQLADFIGLDVCLSVLRVLHRGLGDNKYSPCPLLVQYVDAGRLGKKRGVGVYSYGQKFSSVKPKSSL